MVRPKEQWCSDKNLVDAWIQAVGDSSSPFGDYWRMALVNPVIWMVGSLLADQSSFAPLKLDEVPLDFALAVQQDQLKSFDPNALVDWHAEIARRFNLESLRVLDLGCGEGYLGRWLSEMGAQYLGVDGSEKLISSGKERQRKNIGNRRFELRVLDLEDDKPFRREADLLEQLSPQLVTSTIVFEHLENPVGVLKDAVENLGDSWFGLFFTLNPAYVGVGSGAEESWRVKAKIASADREVDCILRSLRSMHEIFRDSGLQLVSEAFLNLPYRHKLSYEEDAFRGVAPFCAFLVKPLPKMQKVSGAQVEEILSAGFLGQIDQPSKKVLRSMASQLSVLTFKPGQSIIPQNNIGGDLIVLLEGSANLLIDGSVAGVYGQGELLGDLEASSRSELLGYFSYPVVAGPGEVKALRIPALIASTLFDFPPSVAGSLFSQLRNRLLIALWSFNFRKRDIKDIDLPAGYVPFLANRKVKRPTRALALSGTYADKIARMVLASAEAERIVGNRRTNGKIVFVPSAELVKRARIDLKSKGEIQTVLRAFMSLGVVDCFPGAELRRRCRSLYEASWDRVKEAAVQKILLPAFRHADGAKTWSQVMHVALGGGRAGHDAIGADNKMLQNRGDSWVDAVKQFRDELGSLVKSEAWDTAVNGYLSFLGRVNCYWWDKSPSYFLINDPWLLRAFVLEQDMMLAARAFARIAMSPFADHDRPADYKVLMALIQEHAPGRAYSFVRALDDFLVADLDAGAELKFSGDSRTIPVPSF